MCCDTACGFKSCGACQLTIYLTNILMSKHIRDILRQFISSRDSIKNNTVESRLQVVFWRSWMHGLGEEMAGRSGAAPASLLPSPRCSPPTAYPKRLNRDPSYPNEKNKCDDLTALMLRRR